MLMFGLYDRLIFVAVYRGLDSQKCHIYDNYLTNTHRACMVGFYVSFYFLYNLG